MESHQDSTWATQLSGSLMQDLHETLSFDPHQISHLGTYIYALRDPRDRKVFYVGQGQGNRVFNHLTTANALANQTDNVIQTSSKLRRIIDIWSDGYPVDWCIIAHNVDNSTHSIADLIESAVYDGITWSLNGMMSNAVSPPGSTFLDSANIGSLAALPINPAKPMIVFLCNIANSLGVRSEYDATRQYWRLAQRWTNMVTSHDDGNNVSVYGVGLVNGISRSAYEIVRWELVVNVPGQNGKYEFEALGHPHPPLVPSLTNLSWQTIIRDMGYWSQGNPLFVEFNGLGDYRILRGAADADGWSPCC